MASLSAELTVLATVSLTFLVLFGLGFEAARARFGWER